MWRALVFLPLLCVAQDLTKYTIETIAASHKFVEGPVWSAREGHLLFSDVPVNQVFRIDGKGKTVFRENTGGVSGGAYDDKGRLYLCEARTRRVVRLPKGGGAPEVLADAYEGKKLNGPNDIVVTRNQHVYFTDPVFGDAVDSQELPFYGVFHISPKGIATAALKWKTRPNGLALSFDGKVLYVTNSDERNVRAYDVGKDGTLENERVVIEKTDGVPGGIEVDAQGNLFVAAKGVQIFSPAGKMVTNIELAEKPSNLVFGDDSLQTLYVTARTTVYRILLETKGVSIY
ncbi:MAG TPA: SMP-30/gluconolactonase/LRE family protein [Bryobacteraceae bacterium]|nr:SMP-30/gluconolactonase/LRE family protein [Bryobacteraceae bacterium]